jgi:hypothetical protein
MTFRERIKESSLTDWLLTALMTYEDIFGSKHFLHMCLSHYHTTPNTIGSSFPSIKTCAAYNDAD